MRKIILLLGCFLFLYQLVQAQVVNTGEFTILGDTQVGVVSAFDNTQKGALINEGELFIYNNFNNNGLFDFIENSGLTRFEGSQLQQISGSGQSSFFDVLFSNSSSVVPFQLSGNIRIANLTIFNNGIVDNDNFGGSITFEQNATHQGTQNMSHVDGEVFKEGNSSFVFPIGDGGFYRQAEISDPVDGGASFSGHYFLAPSDPQFPNDQVMLPITQIDDTEYWIVERQQGTNSILLTLGWNENTSPAFITNASPENIHIARWDPDLTMWIDEGGIPDASAQSVTTVAEVSGFGVFTLALVQETPQLSLTKMGIFNDENQDGTAQEGETISYIFGVTNIGTVTAFDITINDPLPGIIISGEIIDELAPGEEDLTTFTGTYTITADDIDNGLVTNQATLNAIDPDGNSITDLSDDPTDSTDNDLNNDGEPDDPTVTILPIVLSNSLEIFNAVSANGDGRNDFFFIRGIEDFPDNNVKIFNRWGVLVYETDNYGGNNVFRGQSEGRVTIKQNEDLPTGTYFYILNFPTNNNPGDTNFSGYLYVIND